MHQAPEHQVHFVNKYVEDRLVKIVFVKSADNDSNILTKNLSSNLNKKNSKKMVGEKLKDDPNFKNS